MSVSTLRSTRIRIFTSISTNGEVDWQIDESASDTDDQGSDGVEKPSPSASPESRETEGG